MKRRRRTMETKLKNPFSRRYSELCSNGMESKTFRNE